MANKEKSEIKISLWEQEIKSLELELSFIKEQKAVWQGCAQGYKECLDLLNVYFRKIRLAMNWSQLTKTEKDKYTKLAKKWPSMNRESQIKEYKVIVKNFNELTPEQQNEKLKSTPIPVPPVIMTEKEGTRVVELFHPLQTRITNKLKTAQAEPDMRTAQADVLAKQINRLNNLIQAEKNKMTDADNIDDGIDYNDDYRKEISNAEDTDTGRHNTRSGKE